MMSPEQSSEEVIASLTQQVAQLQRQLNWYKRQLFGEKSEKRLLESNPAQLGIGSLLDSLPEIPPKQPSTKVEYDRAKNRKNQLDGSPDDTGLRFDETVPVKEIVLSCPQLDGPDCDQYEVIQHKTTYRLAQRSVSHVILKYLRPVVKHKASAAIISTPAPAAVIEKSYADVSFLVGMLVDKFVYHQPLYRQHQRLSHNGIKLSRSTLTALSHRSIALLVAIVEAQRRSVLRSRVLAMDETPTKAGRQKKGKLKQAWYWPMYGDQDEVVFVYSPTRSRKVLEKQLVDFEGTLITDGYSAYESYCQSLSTIKHARCWTHCRRYYDRALESDPQRANTALEAIGALYRIEKDCRESQLSAEKHLAHRAKYSKPIVDQFFNWCWEQSHDLSVEKHDPLAKALRYTLAREAGLRLYLSDSAVPMDTNHLERALRPIPMGKRNWLFSWTEIGAERVGIIQSLLVTCGLHGINPYTYLIDVLQRIETHPMARVDELTPRLWKTLFADNPLTSDLDR